MYCSNCGKEVSNDTAYCPECGFKLIQIPDSNHQDQEEIDGFLEDHGDYCRAENNQPKDSNHSIGIG